MGTILGFGTWLFISKMLTGIWTDIIKQFIPTTLAVLAFVGTGIGLGIGGQPHHKLNSPSMMNGTESPESTVWKKIDLDKQDVKLNLFSKEPHSLHRWLFVANHHGHSRIRPVRGRHEMLEMLALERHRRENKIEDPFPEYIIVNATKTVDTESTHVTAFPAEATLTDVPTSDGEISGPTGPEGFEIPPYHNGNLNGLDNQPRPSGIQPASWYYDERNAAFFS